jgi:hypothetical protein
LSLEDVVIPRGLHPDHELRDFYNLCDVFAMPSKGEGFGIVFLEALASGKPVIAAIRTVLSMLCAMVSLGVDRSRQCDGARDRAHFDSRRASSTRDSA